MKRPSRSRTGNLSIIAITVFSLGLHGVSYGADCRVGDVIQPGGSCTYPGTNEVFSVDSAGRARFLNVISDNLSIRNLNINGIAYTFVTERRSGGGQRIVELGPPPAPGVHVVDSDAPPIYWTGYRATESKIQRVNLDGSDVEDVVTGLKNAPDIALDPGGGKMYWTDAATDKIQRANLDGSDAEDIVIGLDSPSQIVLDVGVGKMYWSASNRIKRANLDGSDVEDIVTRSWGLHDIALDARGGKLYWTEFDTDKIQRANLDGSDVEDIVTGLGRQVGIDLDVDAGKVYWTTRRKIRRANLDGSIVEDVVTGLVHIPRAIALDVDGGKMYWTASNRIKRANLDGSDVEDVVMGLSEPRGISLAILLPLGADDGTPARLVRVSGGDQHSQAGSALSKPLVVEVMDRAGVPVAGAEVTFRVIAGGGSLSVENATSDANGRAESVLTLGPEPGTNRVAVSVAGIPGSASFTALAVGLAATTASPLAESTLDGSVVTLALTGWTYKRPAYFSPYSVSVSGIEGVTIHPSTDVKRVGDTDVTARLSFNGNIDEDATLTFAIDGEDALADGSGLALTAQISVTAVAESLVATTPSPLSESALDGSVVSLTLKGRTYVESSAFRISRSLSLSGIEGVTFDPSTDVKRVSDTEVTVRLSFNGNIDEDAMLTFTVDPDAIANYTGPGLSTELSVSSATESFVATTASPLSEPTLDGSVVTLKLMGRSFHRNSLVIAGAMTVSGIEGVTVSRFDVKRVSETEVTIELLFAGDFDVDSTLSITIGADAIEGHEGPAMTASIPVTAVTESLVASSASPLMESALDGAVVTLTLNGRSLESWNRVRNNLAVVNIDGLTFSSFDVERLSNQEVAVPLSFNGDIDFDKTLTFTLDSDAISDYNGSALSAEMPVTAVAESLVASSPAPLTEATLNGSVINLTLTGRSFVRNSVDIAHAVTVSGIDGVVFRGVRDVRRVSDTDITIVLSFTGNINAHATLTFTVPADAIANYNGSALTADLSVGDAKPTPDFDGDGLVGFADFLRFAFHFGLSQGNEAYEAKYDLDGDSTIGFGDFLLFANAFGKDAPSPGNGGGGGSGVGDGRPDLIVESPSVSDDTPGRGTSFRLSATVRNRGDGASAATTLRYFRSTDATILNTDLKVGDDSVIGLSASRSSDESISVTAPSNAGTYYYGACVDSVSGESNTDNNCSDAVEVTVSGDSTGGGNLGACRVGLVVRPNQSCAVVGGAFRNVGGGCFNYTPFGSGRFCSSSFNLNGLRGTQVGSDFRITAVP